MTSGQIASNLIQIFKAGRRIGVCGNGGSACEADHLCGELVGQYTKDHKPLPAISFNTPAITSAIGNDFGYEYVFERQVRAYLKSGDGLVTLTTSGKSKNILRAEHQAERLGVIVMRLYGEGTTTREIQENHLRAIHDISEIVEEYFL